MSLPFTAYPRPYDVWPLDHIPLEELDPWGHPDELIRRFEASVAAAKAAGRAPWTFGHDWHRGHWVCGLWHGTKLVQRADQDSEHEYLPTCIRANEQAARTPRWQRRLVPVAACGGRS